MKLFHQAGKTLREADTFEALSQYRAAISALLAKKLVDEAIRRLGSEAYMVAVMAKGERETLLHRTVRVGVRQAQRLIGGAEPADKRAGVHTMELVMRIIDSFEERVALLKESGCTRQLLQLYINEGANYDAAGLLMEVRQRAFTNPTISSYHYHQDFVSLTLPR